MVSSNRGGQKKRIMLFYSFIFVVFFLPTVVTGFFVCHRYFKKQGSKVFLIIASFIFYGSWNPIYVPLLAGSIIVNFYFSNSLRVSKSRIFLWLGVILNLVLLGYFKYMDFFIENINVLFNSDLNLLKIALPLGISFFTFQQIAYLVDSYKSKTGRHNFIDYTLFVIFFPQLVAGPIVHWREMMPQFDALSHHRFNLEHFAKGLNIFALGFLKKVLIADNLAIIVDDVFANQQNLDMATSWLGGICFMLQIYFDFSAYSEMAIGAALMMNIKLPVNFNSPYKAKNINEFWNRWHITLTRWFFQYTFLPITAFWSRKKSAPAGVSMPALIFTTLFIFLLSGLWHGAQWTFVIWGGMHGLALVVYRLWQACKLSMPTILARALTVLFLIYAAVAFRADDLSHLLYFTSAMFGHHGLLNEGTFVADNFAVLCLCSFLPLYITFYMPNTLQIVGYERIQKDDGNYYVAPLTKLNADYFSMDRNYIIAALYGLIFSLVLIDVMTADTPAAFIYFDF